MDSLHSKGAFESLVNAKVLVKVWSMLAYILKENGKLLLEGDGKAISEWELAGVWPGL